MLLYKGVKALILPPQITFHQMEVIINHSLKKKNQAIINFSIQSRVRIPHDYGERVVLVAGH